MSGLVKGTVTAKRESVRACNRKEVLTCMRKTIDDTLKLSPTRPSISSYWLSIQIRLDLKAAGYAIYRFKHRTFNER